MRDRRMRSAMPSGLSLQATAVEEPTSTARLRLASVPRSSLAAPSRKEPKPSRILNVSLLSWPRGSL